MCQLRDAAAAALAKFQKEKGLAEPQAHNLEEQFSKSVQRPAGAFPSYCGGNKQIFKAFEAHLCKILFLRSLCCKPPMSNLDC